MAQAELEDREVAGCYYRLAFRGPDGTPVPVATTRPELLPACVALVAHPDDQRYAALAGGTVTTPLFGVPVPVLTHPLADPAKGTGIAMICTFGDTTDVTWWRDLDLPVRPVLGPDGRLLAAAPPGITSQAGRSAYRQLAGATLAEARQRIWALARASGDLLGEPEPVTPPGEVLREGRHPAGDHHHPAVVPAQRRPGRAAARRADRPGPGDQLASGAHAGPLRELGDRADRRLAAQPAALLRRADPGLVPAGRGRPAAL